MKISPTPRLSHPPKITKSASIPFICGFLLLTLALPSCLVGPDYTRPDLPVPEAYKTALKAYREDKTPDTPPATALPIVSQAEQPPADQTPITTEKTLVSLESRKAKHKPAKHAVTNTWWTLFNDSTLNQLIEECLTENPDIEAAIARVDQARALVKAANAGFFPTIDANPSASRSRTPSSGSGFTSNLTRNNFSLPLDLSYEIDVWGKVRRAKESAEGSALASEADYAVVLQTTLSELAQNYFQLHLYDT